MIQVQNRRRKPENIKKDFPNAVIVDVTSKGEDPMVKFSPFFPVGEIPIPFSEGEFAESVEGIWQGLKVFEHHDVDELKFRVWVLDNKLTAEVEELRELARTKDVILLDYETNGDVDDPRKPLSHAQLVKKYLDGKF